MEHEQCVGGPFKVISHAKLGGILGRLRKILYFDVRGRTNKAVLGTFKVPPSKGLKKPYWFLAGSMGMCYIGIIFP